MRHRVAVSSKAPRRRGAEGESGGEHLSANAGLDAGRTYESVWHARHTPATGGLAEDARQNPTICQSAGPARPNPADRYESPFFRIQTENEQLESRHIGNALSQHRVPPRPSTAGREPPPPSLESQATARLHFPPPWPLEPTPQPVTPAAFSGVNLPIRQPNLQPNIQPRMPALDPPPADGVSLPDLLGLDLPAAWHPPVDPFEVDPGATPASARPRSFAQNARSPQAASLPPLPSSAEHFVPGPLTAVYPYRLLFPPSIHQILDHHPESLLPSANHPLALFLAHQKYTYHHEQPCPFSYVPALIDMLTGLEGDCRVAEVLLLQAYQNLIVWLPRVKVGHSSSFQRARLLFDFALAQAKSSAQPPGAAMGAVAHSAAKEPRPRSASERPPRPASARQSNTGSGVVRAGAEVNERRGLGAPPGHPRRVITTGWKPESGRSARKSAQEPTRESTSEPSPSSPIGSATADDEEAAKGIRQSTRLRNKREQKGQKGGREQKEQKEQREQREQATPTTSKDESTDSRARKEKRERRDRDSGDDREVRSRLEEQ